MHVLLCNFLFSNSHLFSPLLLILGNVSEKKKHEDADENMVTDEADEEEENEDNDEDQEEEDGDNEAESGDED